MQTVIISYLVSVPVFFAIDMLWLGVVASSLYRSQLGHLLSDTVNWPVFTEHSLDFLRTPPTTSPTGLLSAIGRGSFR